MADLATASRQREERLIFAEVDKRIDLLLAHGADRFEKVTSNPRKMGYLRFLLRHYSKQTHLWTACYHDNLKRFGPQRTKGLCGVLKDVIRQNSHWRGKGPQPSDHGAPGVAIGQADAWAAPAWGGHHHHLSEDRPLSLLDDLDLEFGAVDHTEPLADVVDVLITLGEHCDIFRVLIGLDEPPTFKEAVAA